MTPDIEVLAKKIIITDDHSNDFSIPFDLIPKKLPRSRLIPILLNNIPIPSHSYKRNPIFSHSHIVQDCTHILTCMHNH